MKVGLLLALLTGVGPAAGSAQSSEGDGRPTWSVEVRQRGSVMIRALRLGQPASLTFLDMKCFLARTELTSMWKLPDDSAVTVDGCNAAADVVMMRRVTLGVDESDGGPTIAGRVTPWVRISPTMTAEQQQAFAETQRRGSEFRLAGEVPQAARIIVTIGDDTAEIAAVEP